MMSVRSKHQKVDLPLKKIKTQYILNFNFILLQNFKSRKLKLNLRIKEVYIRLLIEVFNQ